MALTIEVFVTGSPACGPACELVQDMACGRCTVHVRDIREASSDADARAQAAAYGLDHFPAVVIDGTVMECCAEKRPLTRSGLAASIAAFLKARKDVEGSELVKLA